MAEMPGVTTWGIEDVGVNSQWSRETQGARPSHPPSLWRPRGRDWPPGVAGTRPPIAIRKGDGGSDQAPSAGGLWERQTGRDKPAPWGIRANWVPVQPPSPSDLGTIVPQHPPPPSLSLLYHCPRTHVISRSPHFSPTPAFQPQRKGNGVNMRSFCLRDKDVVSCVSCV